MKIAVITIVATVALLSGGIYLLNEQSKPREASAAETTLAACLKEKNVVMHGAYWCPHCRSQKEQFGSAFEQVPYVECTQDTKTCQDRQIQSYPTWIFPDNTRLVGEQPLAALAEKAGCTYQPEGNN